jgi:hypothetical protein
MHTLITALAGQPKNVGIVAALLTAGAVAGWAMPATVARLTASAEDPLSFRDHAQNGTKTCRSRSSSSVSFASV